MKIKNPQKINNTNTNTRGLGLRERLVRVRVRFSFSFSQINITSSGCADFYLVALASSTSTAEQAAGSWPCHAHLADLHLRGFRFVSLQ
jgi:hypothetical protein